MTTESQPVSPFQKLRHARMLVLLACSLAVTGPMVLLLLPLFTVAVLAKNREYGMLKGLGASLLFTLPLGFVLLAIEPVSNNVGRVFGVLLFGVGVLAVLFSPLWLAAKLLQPRIGTLRTGAATLLALHGISAPALLLLVLGFGGVASAWLYLMPLGLVVVALLCCLPLLYALPPLPELEPLAADLGLTKTFKGWEGDGISLSRRGRLEIWLPFSSPISGLHAAKRGQASTLPLLGDAVLDQTLEAALPGEHSALADEPALLLAAVHGAGAQVGEAGISVQRKLDRKAWIQEPEVQRAQLIEEVHAVRALFARIQGPRRGPVSTREAKK